MSRLRGFFLWLALLCLGGMARCAESRDRNDTLRLPLMVPSGGMQIVDAFPGLTFVRPVSIVSPPKETNQLYVVEKGGKIFAITNLAAPDKTLFLDLGGRVQEEWYSENGLLGLAFHPLYQAGAPGGSNFVFVFYTGNTVTASGSGLHDRLVRYEINPANFKEVWLESELPLISQFDESTSHNGGDLHFGPNGYLYISTGDEGGVDGQYGNSRIITNDFFSAMLRIDVDRRPGSLEPNPHFAIHTNTAGQANYSVPATNPFIGATRFNGEVIDPLMVRTEFWAVGFRNLWRFSIDPEAGEIYGGDVGAYSYEEINLIQPGRDYGWRYKEGFHDFQNGIPVGTVLETNLSAPLVEYSHIGGVEIPGGKAEGAAVTGGVVYRGSKIPELHGHYVFGDFGSGRIFALRQTNGAVTAFRQIATTSNPSAFGRDPSNGDVLIAHYENFGGSIQRLILSAEGDPDSSIPATLSRTGAFRDLASLEPEAGILPYEINLPFWSDHARKRRWFSIPDTNQTMTFSASGNWLFPTGAVWIKHFDLELTNGVPESARRLETRFLVKNTEGVHGFTYRWNAAQTDADLVGSGGQDELIPVYRPDGSLLRNQTWRYPGRSECLQCHTPQGGYALGFNTVQLNRAHDFGIGPTNQIAQLSRMGYFDGPTPDPETLPRLAPASDVSASLEHRVRSYLQANCVQCHQPGGVARGTWDARIATPTAEAGILNGALVNNDGDTANRVVRTGSLDQSMLFRRVSQMGSGHMPPLGTSELNEEAIELLRQWITSGVGSVTVTWTGSGPLHLSYVGEPARSYRIEASTDLVQWQPVATVVATATGAVEYSAESGSEAARFYRVVWP